MVQSRIFARNRTLGYVSNHIPLVTRYILRRKEHFVVTYVGQEFHTYGYKHFWDFKPGKGMTTARTISTLEKSIEWIRYHNESSLVAIALENFDIVLMDLDTRKIVRHFQGHEGRVTDACFNPDSRWLITASMDCTIRTWDIPSSHLIDIFQVPEACISLSFSPTAEFLATAHVHNIGIFLWSNRMLYSHVSLKAISKDDMIPEVLLPGSSVETEEKVDENVVAPEPDYISPDQLDSNLITMSGVAQSRWRNLFDIDIIKNRNKPQQPPKAPETAPFFLPTIPSLQLHFDFSDVKTAHETETLRIRSALQNLTSFNKSLQSITTSDNFSEVIEKLKAMNPSDIDFEIQSVIIRGLFFLLMYIYNYYQKLDLGAVFPTPSAY